MTTSQDRFLYYLSVWKIFSKNSFFTQPQGVSLSIADAKVDTFKLLAKQSGDFFSRKIEEKSQLADFQDYQFYESLQAFSKSVISMLQNTKKTHMHNCAYVSSLSYTLLQIILHYENTNVPTHHTTPAWKAVGDHTLHQ